MPDLYEILKSTRRVFATADATRWLQMASQDRVENLASILQADLAQNLPRIYQNRDGLDDYRANPYVLLATANVMDLSDPEQFASFLFNSKLSMGLETSFGKIVERAFVGAYPCDGCAKWSDPPEKLAEFEVEKAAIGRQAKAAIRNRSVWREIDKGVTVGRRRYLTSIKSGPNTINDTQVQGMVDAIASKHQTWWTQSLAATPTLQGLDIVVGLSYGTEKSTNNKDNQILAKLLDHGFVEEDRTMRPGVLVDAATRSIRVYRRVGQSFWSWIGDPSDESRHPHVFVEVLLALSIALSNLLREGSAVEDGINQRLVALSTALARMRFQRNALPDWLTAEVGDKELFWFATALSAFFDEGV